MKHTKKDSTPECVQQKVTVQNRELIFTDSSRTLLECLEADNIEVHYHCRDGYCGACRITLNKGQVIYPNGEPLAYIGENEILPCCCKPTTNIDITVE